VEKIIKLCDIRLDGGTQPRTEIDQNLVDEYAENIEKLPAVDVFHDGANYWLVDGFHRYFAHQNAGKKEIPANIKIGTVRDAILFSVGVNACHGKRRTNEDKRKAVLTLLNDEEWGKWSSSKIADLCKVSHTFVDNIRNSLATVASDNRERVYTNKQGQTVSMDISNIGKKTKSEQKLATKQERNISDTLDTIAYEQVINILSDASQATLRAVLDWIEGML
jgi:hypothetical protein